MCLSSRGGQTILDAWEIEKQIKKRFITARRIF